jgi:predicted nucleic acid-binding protein
VLAWGDAFPLIETGASVVLGALDLTRSHQLSIWDSVILSAAADARCRASNHHPLLDALLNASARS